MRSLETSENTMKDIFVIVLVMFSLQALAQQDCRTERVEPDSAGLSYTIGKVRCNETNNYCGTGQAYIYAQNGYWGFKYKGTCIFCDFMNNYCNEGDSFHITNNGQTFDGKTLSGMYFTVSPFKRHMMFVDSQCHNPYTSKEPPVVIERYGLFGYYVGSCFCHHDNYFCGTPQNPGPAFGIPLQ